MANSAQARKRARQAIVRRNRNAGERSRYRTFIKKVQAATEAGDKDAANTALKAAIPVLDGMVVKGILHKNTAARYKSRLNARILKIA